MTWKFWKRPPANPAVAAYIAETSRRIPKKTPLTEIRFVVLDTETTGFDIHRDRLLSLATIEITDAKIRVAQSAAWTIYQPAPAVNKATAIHGILPSQTAAGQPEPEVLLEFLARIHGAILVGHHVGFDIAMLNIALQRHFKTTLRNPCLNTAAFAMSAIEAFAKTAYAGQREPTLDEVCAQCAIAPLDRHTAEGDAFTTAQIFLSMCALRRRRLARPLTTADLPLRSA